MKFEDLLYRVRPRVVGCPEPMILDALQSAAEELCRKSHVWQVKLDPASIYSGIGHYQLPTPAYTRIVSPLRIYIDGTLLEYRHEEALDNWDPQWRSRTGPTPHWWTMDAPDQVRIVPAPESDQTDVLVARASVQPAERDVNLPDWFEEYIDTLRDGALAELAEIPGQPWSQPKMAEYYRRRFKSGVASVRYDVSRRFTDQPVRTRAYPR